MPPLMRHRYFRTLGHKTAPALHAWLLGIGFTIGMPMISHAAPYCLQQDNGLQCEYATYASCVAASSVESDCLRNPHEPIQMVGTAPFCVFSELQADCSFHEGHSCHKAAMLSSGICAKNPTTE